MIASDVFPPRCGGAGWSAYYLARALRARGHRIVVVRPRFDAAARRAAVAATSFDGFPIVESVIPLPRHPLGRILARNLVAPRRLQDLMAREAAAHAVDLIHAQHALTVPAAVAAGTGLPVVATVRDYWPLSYFSTMQVPLPPVGQSSALDSDRARHDARDTQSATRNPQSAIQNSTLPALARAFWRTEGARSLRRWPLLPLWQCAAARRRRALGRADAVIAVSRFVAAALRRGRAVAPARLHIIPNLVDLPHLDAVVAAPAPRAALGLAPDQPFLLFVGKLEPSKGAHLLPALLEAAGVGGSMPLVLAGSGPLRPGLEAAARARGLDLRFSDWLDNDDVLRLMHGATLLLFPSAWDEPLSRVLLEACAAGAPILALDTGGTPDILVDGGNGRLVADLPAFAAALSALLADPAARARLAAGARATAELRFSADVVGAQVEALYRALLERAPA